MSGSQAQVSPSILNPSSSAVYLVDSVVRPAWEAVSLGTFAHGRVDWFQTVSSPVRTFIEAATDENSLRVYLRSLFDAVTTEYSQAMLSAARGGGLVNHMYASRGVVKAEEHGNIDKIPSLFNTVPWNATRRGGPGKGRKIGFMPISGMKADFPWMVTAAFTFAHHEYAVAICESIKRAAATISTPSVLKAIAYGGVQLSVTERLSKCITVASQ
ncbi:hypothetical protein F5B19DRAFT_490272 [Rostrohypoxylon terebratum]|nr:hypothetical protein F5B19DRAFT_490272 [Rostrohypoxylon terebratum]